MHPFATYVLRSYYKATGWNEDNLFANLTRSSSAILDFTVPRGLNLSISKSPNALFKTTYSINAMPSLHGSIGYIFTSCDLNVKGSANAQFKDMIDCFKVYDQPRIPEGREEEWLAGERVDAREYLMYGRLYLPTGRLDALYSTRLSATVQALVAAISEPPSSQSEFRRNRTGGTSNIMFNIQHDVGKWCTEYTYSAEDGMCGVKLLHNFGKLGGSLDTSEESEVSSRQPPGVKRVDEEEPIEGGLKGRVSLGAELYFSAKERSAGVSTGIRFTTLPDATPPSHQIPSSASASHKLVPPQPPTTITALFNPMLGYISGAYTAQVNQDLSLSSRFEFNVYSFESDWTMGAEWWLRSPPESEGENGTGSQTMRDVHGVLKARASTSNNISLLWEGRLKSMLVGLGVVADLSHRSRPIRGVGLELSYFSSD
ncbi:mitochondrial distribution and morphology protein 10 [Amanita rubescens]|nr:mitochondrial distribution and morphology protein 10 [Amanita rubescens]